MDHLSSAQEHVVTSAEILADQVCVCACRFAVKCRTGATMDALHLDNLCRCRAALYAQTTTSRGSGFEGQRAAAPATQCAVAGTAQRHSRSDKIK